jgi:hypothetical protein
MAVSNPENYRLARIMQQDVAIREMPISLAQTATENFQAMLGGMQAMFSHQMQIMQSQSAGVEKISTATLAMLAGIVERTNATLKASAPPSSDDESKEPGNNQAFVQLGQETIRTVGDIIKALIQGGPSSNKPVPPLLRKMLEGDIADVLEDPDSREAFREEVEQFRKEPVPKKPVRKKEES